VLLLFLCRAVLTTPMVNTSSIRNFKYLVVGVFGGFWIRVLGSFNDCLVFSTFNVKIDGLLLTDFLLGVRLPKGRCSLKAIKSLLFLVELRLCFEQLLLVKFP
jgi:hypothetical protein